MRVTVTKAIAAMRRATLIVDSTRHHTGRTTRRCHRSSCRISGWNMACTDANMPGVGGSLPATMFFSLTCSSNSAGSSTRQSTLPTLMSSFGVAKSRGARPPSGGIGSSQTTATLADSPRYRASRRGTRVLSASRVGRIGLPLKYVPQTRDSAFGNRMPRNCCATLWMVQSSRLTACPSRSRRVWMRQFSATVSPAPASSCDTIRMASELSARVLEN